MITSKDVRLPVQLQRAMAAEAEAAREARAKVMMVMLVVMMVMMVVKILVIIVMMLVLMLVIIGQGHNVGMRTWNLEHGDQWIVVIVVQVIAAEGEQKASQALREVGICK